MIKNIERQITIFTESTGLVDRAEIVHGTLYVKFKDNKDCDFFHTELRNFFRKFINLSSGVNMWLVGDEFAFDFVPEDDEQNADEPVSSKIDTMLELENEMNWGK